jgi:CubicO group peptidase (beta-lactamase class C family)
MAKPGRRWPYILLTLIIGALCVSFGPAYDAFRMGNGYAAKVAASAMHVGGRTLDQIRDQELSILSFVTLNVDESDQSVTASIAGLADEKAVYDPRFGATLVHGREDAVAERRAGASPRAALGDPVMFTLNADVPGVDYAALNESITWATTEANATAPINTRAVAVFYDGQLVGEGFAEGFDRTSRFAGFSMTKSVTSALIGILVKQGKLEVDAPAPIPSWHGENDPRAAITLNHMLQMSTGLAFGEQYFNPFADAVRMLFVESDAPGYAMKKPLEAAPGEKWYYSSGTTNMLQWIIRKQFDSDEAYWRFPYEELFAPIGMHSALLEPDASGTYVGSSFMWATAHDWARFGLLFLNDGVWEGNRILPEGWVEYSVTPAPAAPRGNYGAQWWLNAGAPGDPEDRPMPELPTDTYFASGFEGQKVYVIPSRKAVIVRLGCTQGPGWSNPGFAARVLEALPGA